jgi:fragile X mental retardation protein
VIQVVIETASPRSTVFIACLFCKNCGLNCQVCRKISPELSASLLICPNGPEQEESPRITFKMEQPLSKDFLEHAAVEVEGENGIFYKAYVMDVEPIEESTRNESAVFVEDKYVNAASPMVLLRFENDWQPKTFFPVDRIRLPPPFETTEESNAAIHIGDEVEVLASDTDQEPFGWFRAKVQMSRGGFFVLNYITPVDTVSSNNDQRPNKKGFLYQEIVPSERVRIKNPNQRLRSYPFFKFAIDLGEAWQGLTSSLLDWMNRDEGHSQFRQLIGAIAVRHNPAANKLNVIGYTTGDRTAAADAMYRSATMLSELHVRNLRQKAILLAHTEEVAKQLESTRIGRSGSRDHGNNGGSFGNSLSNQTKHFTAEFSVPSHLMGLAIGTHGKSIQNARQVENVLDIQLNEDTCTFR